MWREGGGVGALVWGGVDQPTEVRLRGESNSGKRTAGIGNQVLCVGMTTVVCSRETRLCLSERYFLQNSEMRLGCAFGAGTYRDYQLAVFADDLQRTEDINPRLPSPT